MTAAVEHKLRLALMIPRKAPRSCWSDGYAKGVASAPYKAMARNFCARTLLRNHCPAGNPVMAGTSLAAAAMRFPDVTPTSRLSVLACAPRSLQCLATPLALASPISAAFSATVCVRARWRQTPRTCQAPVPLCLPWLGGHPRHNLAHPAAVLRDDALWPWSPGHLPQALG